MNKGSDRREAVVKMVKQEQSIKITELSRRLGVSSMTIRRDLERLSDAGLIKVLYGAVFFTGKDETNPLTEYRLSEAQTLQVEEKKRIALYAAGLIKEGDILFLDAGSTTYYLAKYLPEEFPFTVICYSLNIFLRYRNTATWSSSWPAESTIRKPPSWNNRNRRNCSPGIGRPRLSSPPAASIPASG